MERGLVDRILDGEVCVDVELEVVDVDQDDVGDQLADEQPDLVLGTGDQHVEDEVEPVEEVVPEDLAGVLGAERDDAHHVLDELVGALLNRRLRRFLQSWTGWCGTCSSAA